MIEKTACLGEMILVLKILILFFSFLFLGIMRIFSDYVNAKISPPFIGAL